MPTNIVDIKCTVYLYENICIKFRYLKDLKKCINHVNLEDSTQVYIT